MSHRPARCAAAAAALLLLAAPGGALTIDDFEVGDFTVTATTFDPIEIFEQTGLPNANVRGGIRLIRSIVATPSVVTEATVTTSLTTTPLDDNATFSVTGLLPPTGDFHFVYDGIAGGTGNGSSGALDLNLTGFVSIDVETLGLSLLGATLEVQLFSPGANQTLSSPLSTTGVHSFLLTDFAPVDTTDIKAIAVRLLGIGTLDTVQVLSIEAVVPEPGTGLLLAAGLVGLAARRGRRSLRSD